MANTIKHKRSSVAAAVPAAATLTQGELAINTADGKLYTKKDSGTVIDVVADCPLPNISSSAYFGYPTAGDTPTIAFSRTTSSLNQKEQSLGNPAVDGYILSSDVVGNRTWIAPNGSSVTEASLSTQREMQYLKNAGVATYTAVGMVAPVNKTAGTVVTADDADGPWNSHPTTATINQSAGYLSTFTSVQRSWNPEFITTIKSDATNPIISIRYWCGFASTDMSGVAVAPTTQHIAAFRYDSALDTGTINWRAITHSGTGSPTVTNTGISLLSGTAYLLRIVCSATDVKFYINGTLVATHTTTLPTLTQGMGYFNTMTVLTAAIKSIKIGRLAIRHNG